MEHTTTLRAKPGTRFLWGAIVALATTALCLPDAQARSIRVDDTLQDFQVAGPSEPNDDLANNGSSGPIAIRSYNLLPPDGARDDANPLYFSVNVFGTSYDSFYINENGSISFGDAFSGRPSNADPAFAGMPVFAPFFADVDTNLQPFGGAVSWGFFPFQNGIAITWSSVGYEGAIDSSQRQDFQIIIIDISDATGNEGDFRLEFNYEGGFNGMVWETGDSDGGTNGLGGDSARVGFWDGFGVGFEVEGSGVNGALLGAECLENPFALSCNDYFYEFRNGTPYTLDGAPLIDTPEPGSTALLLGGIGILAWARKRRPRRTAA